MESNKKTRGRQKITIKKIESEDDLYASFTKRRNGIYKKASELCTLCNIDIGIIIFSPTRKPFSFFHPDMDSIIHRLFNLNLQPNESTLIAEAHTRAKVEKLNQKLDELSAQAEAEIERGKNLDQMDEAQEEEKEWWDKPIGEYTEEEVGKMTEIYKDLQVQIIRRINELRNGGASSSSGFPDQENQDVSARNLAQRDVIDPTKFLGDVYFGGTTDEANYASHHGTIDDPITASHLSSFGIPENMVDLNQTIDQGNMANFPLDMLYPYPGGGHSNTNVGYNASSSFSFPPVNDYPSYGHGDVGFSPSSLPPVDVPGGVRYPCLGGTTQMDNITSSSFSFAPPNYAPNVPYAYGSEMLGAYNITSSSLSFQEANEPNRSYDQHRSGTPEDSNAYPHGRGDN